MTTAIRSERTEIIRLLLKGGADVNHVNMIGPSHETPLQIALFSKNREIVRILIAAGADLNYRDEQGATPLHFAVEHARTFVVSDMIALGMNINARDSNGNTPLTVAAKRSCTDIVELLLAAGAQEPKSPDAPKIGALAYAAMNKHKKLFKILLEARGLPDTLSPFIKSFVQGDPEIAMRLNAYIGADLLEAANLGDEDTLHALLAQGRNVTTRNDKGETALIIAARQGHETCARILVNAGSDVNALSIHGQTALMGATRNGHASIVSMLLSHGADIHAIDGFGVDAILAAAMRGNQAIVDQLVDAGCTVGLAEAGELGDLETVRDLLVDGQSIETKNAAGMTALHGAAAGGHLELIRFLLRRGADMNARDGQSNTPMQRAVQRNHTAVAAFLIEAGTDVNLPGRSGITPLQNAGLIGNLVLMRSLLAHGADPNGTGDPDHHVPLISTILPENEDAIALLLEAGANPNAVDKHGWTVLTFAVGIGSPGIVGALLDAGANPDDNQAIRMLRTRHGHDEPEMERIFIERGIDINPRRGREVPKGPLAEIIADISNIKTPEDRVKFLEELRKRVRAKRDEKNFP